MSKPWAKIVVRSAGEVGWWVELHTDLPQLWHQKFVFSKAAALSRARAWIRRLKSINEDVEVE